jgi:hypothetical protein
MMQMSFYWDSHMTWWFDDWTSRSDGEFVLGLLGTFVMIQVALIFGAFKKVVHKNNRGVKSIEWWLEFLLTLVSTCMHLMTMLLIMSYNAWILIICVLAYGVGFLCIDLGQK